MNTIIEAITDFIRHCKFEKNLSGKTLTAYETDLTQFNSFLSEKNLSLCIKFVSKFELRQYLESLSHLKPKSIKRKMASLKAMFNYLEFDEQIDINPVRKMRIKIKEPQMLPKVMELKEIGKILKTAYKCRRNIIQQDSYSSLEALRNIIVIELLFSTGARVSEIANLKTDDINLATGEVMINGKGKKQRIIQVCNEDLLTLLRGYKKLWEDRMIISGNNFLVNRFNKKMSDQSIRLLVRRLYKEAGIKKHITPHVFRHSFATLLLENDVDIKYIQEMLGHSSIAITQIYTHVNKHKQWQLLRTKHPRRELSFAEFD
jgi:integrase/recombinase XerD